MNKLKFFSIALMIFGANVHAQDLNQAKKAIDAEQYDKAKSILKSLIISKPDSGKNFFFLGNVYLTQKLQDSAKITFEKGLLAKTESHFNNIGLGQIDLENGNKADAKIKFDKAIENIRKKDVEELVFIGHAYCNPVNPDYKTALIYLDRAKTAQPMDAQVQSALGDAYAGDKMVNEAFSAYRNAADSDKSGLYPKLRMGVLTRNSKAFVEAKATFDAILAVDPSYGPAYRELAETFYLWALNDKANYVAYNKTAIEYYEKYMSLTDYSIDSRMRHADFLILTKDYKALEKEADAMQKLDKVNPRILRYLGYSSYENENNDAAIKALNDFMASNNAKIIGRDYLYLGFAKARKALVSTKKADGTIVNTVDKDLFDSGIADLKKGIDLDPVMANELNDFGKKYFELKLYREAAAIYEVAVLNPNSRNFLYDNFYLGYSLYYDNANKQGQKVDLDALKKADTAFSNVITSSPTTQDAYIYRARVNSLIENDPVAKEEMVKNYEEYIKVVTEKGQAEMDKPATKTKFVEAYNNIGIHYAKTDKLKAKENFEKALSIDPENQTAISTMKMLKI
ncbi:MAG: hypothetical protein ACI7YS_02870 [Flavobacterium sp.]